MIQSGTGEGDCIWGPRKGAGATIRQRSESPPMMNSLKRPAMMALPPVNRRRGEIASAAGSVIMNSELDISLLYREFTDALVNLLAEQSISVSARGQLARARAAVRSHPNFNEHGYFLAIESAFSEWQAMQNSGRYRTAYPRTSKGNRYFLAQAFAAFQPRIESTFVLAARSARLDPVDKPLVRSRLCGTCSSWTCASYLEWTSKPVGVLPGYVTNCS